MYAPYHMAAPIPRALPPSTSPSIDGLMLFGATAVALMFLCRSQQARVPLAVIGVIFFGFMAGVYGFVAGAWPLGVAQIGYALWVYRDWFLSQRHGRIRGRIYQKTRGIRGFQEESRVTRLFGLS